jgi:hypothetical protein
MTTVRYVVVDVFCDRCNQARKQGGRGHLHNPEWTLRELHWHFGWKRGGNKGGITCKECLKDVKQEAEVQATLFVGRVEK